MADFLQYLRQQNIFGPRPPIMGNDLPSQGGITGRLPPGPNTQMDIMGAADPTMFMPPPQFNADTNYLGNLEQPTFGSTDITQPVGLEEFAPTPDLPNRSRGDMDAGQRMGELYQPQTEATDRFNELVRSYPQAKDPSWLRRIGSMIVDYTKGSQRGQQFFNEPHTRAVEDWKNQVQPAQQAANLERYENVNQRTLAYNQIAAELREKAQQAKERNDDRNAKIREDRARIYEFRARNPGWKVIATKGGNVQLYNPLTGETKDSGIPTGSLTELDKIELQGEQRLDQIAATGEQARETEKTRQTGRVELAGVRGEEARQTRETVPGGVTGQGGSPQQVKVAQYNKARQIANSSPALSRFIKLGSGNEFTIVKPGERGGPTPQQYSDIINNIYGNASGPGRSSMSGPGPGQPAVNAPSAPKGWKYVKKPDGGWTAVPDTGKQ